MIAQWDEVESKRAEAGHIAGLWTKLGSAAGTKTVGLCRIRVDPGKWSTPFHRQTAEEEIFYVLAGGRLPARGRRVRGASGRLHRPPRA